MGAAQTVSDLHPTMESDCAKAIGPGYNCAVRVCRHERHASADQLRIQHLSAIARKSGSKWLGRHHEPVLLRCRSPFGRHLELGGYSRMVGTFQFHLSLYAGAV